MTKVTVVIMCGGSGTRLWPASRPARPKQFIPLIGAESLFEQTLLRVAQIKGLHRILVVAGAQHADYVAAQTGNATVPVDVLLEREGRDSAPAIAAATAYVHNRDASDVLVLAASDHYIPNATAFCSDIDLAVEGAVAGGIVTLGIAPEEPSSAYGYIQPDFSSGSIGSVRSFFEKPDRKTAASYIQNGFLWNSGNFIASVDTLSTAFEATAPEVLRAARAGVATARDTGTGLVLGAAFDDAPKVSFDYAVMEKYADRKVVRSVVAWSDLGAWDAVHRAMLRDEENNVAHGDAVFVDVHNCHVRVAEGRTAVLSNVDGLNVVVDDDAVLVSRLDRAQEVKTVVQTLQAEGRAIVDVPARGPDVAQLASHWRSWLNTAVLPLWWTHGFDHLAGLWRESLRADDAGPTGAAVRARVQGRQAYAYASAGTDGWKGPWEQAFRGGLDAIARYYKTEDGLLQTLVNANGAVQGTDVYLYDQTFYLLALCEGRAVLEQAEEKSLAALDAIEARFRRAGPDDGFKETGDHPFQANTHMHLFEAAMAWVEAGGSDRWTVLAREIAQLATTRMVGPDGGPIREFYRADWTPAAGADGRVLEPGHQFEWAWLLKRWAFLSGEDHVSPIAGNLFRMGLKGVDRKRTIAVLQMDDAFRHLSPVARLWTQTEWLRAAVALGADASDPDVAFYASFVPRAAEAVDRFLQTEIRGLWFDKMNADGSFVAEDVPASTLYHIVGAVRALEQAAGQQQG